MPVKAGQIAIDLTLGQTQLFLGIVEAKAKIKDLADSGGRSFRELGQHGVSSVQATSGALRTLEGNFTNNIRAVERFVATTLGLGPALQKIFPLIGAAATAGVFVEMGKKAYDFFKQIAEAPDKIGNAFRQLNQPLRLTNDELALANARIEEDIAKLEGRHANTLASALAEARVEADKLADSLENDLAKVADLLKQQGIGRLSAIFTHRESTSDDEEEIKRFRDQVAGIDRRGDLAVRGATTKPAAEAAQKAWDKELDDALAIEIASFNDVVKRMRANQDARAGRGNAPTVAAYYLDQEAARRDGRAPKYTGVPGSGSNLLDESGRLKESEGTLSNLQYLRDSLGLRLTNTADKNRLGELRTGAANDAQDRPFADRMKALGAQIEGVKAKLEAIGKPEAAQLIAKAFGESQKVIEEVNKALERYHIQLDDAEKAAISGSVSIIVNTEAEAQWKEKLAASTSSITERIAATNQLTDAIGKGYEATKQASVESRLMQELGQHYGDTAWMAEHLADVERLRAGFSIEFDAQHAQQSAQAVDHLHDQIDLEKALAAAQKDGAEAVRQATLAASLERLKLAGATQAEIKAEMDLYNAQRENAAAADIAKIQEQIEATERLTAAIGQGAAATRAAALENKLAAIQRDTSEFEKLTTGILGPDGKTRTPREYAAIDQDSVEHKGQVAQTAVQADRLGQIDEEIEKLKEARAIYGDTIGIQIRMRELENQHLERLVQETLFLGHARDGVRAFFIEMQENAKSAAQIVYETLNSAFERSSATLAKLITGQYKKGDFGKELKELGESTTQSALKSLAQQGLGKLGNALGISIGGAKPDGTRGNPIWVQMAGASTTSSAPGSYLGAIGGKGGVFGGSQGGGIFSFLGHLLNKGGGAANSTSAPGDYLSSIGIDGARAMGGGVDPGKTYEVGEEGPELLEMGGMQGTVIPNHALGGGGVTNVTHIDARGADMGVYNRLARLSEAQNRAAVAKSVQANHERSRRTPQ